MGENNKYLGEDEAFELGFEKQVDMWKEGEVEVGEILPKYIPLHHPFFILYLWCCFLHSPFWLVNAYELPYKKIKMKELEALYHCMSSARHTEGVQSSSMKWRKEKKKINKVRK